MATILIVDDQPANRELIVALAGYAGHRALEAGDGAEGLAVVRAERPQLVICDILMPTMDGYEFVRRLRADPELAATTVMFYTANYHEREARNLAGQLGVARILVKPSDAEQIVEAIELALSTVPVPASAPGDDFSRAHLRLLTDKLAAKADELERANQRLATLTELNLQLSAERDTHALLDRVCQGARQLTGARYALLCIRASCNGHSIGFWGYGLSPEESGRLQKPVIDGGVFARVMSEGRPVRFRNPDGRPEGIGLPAGFPPVHCGVAAPIASALAVFGWVCLLDKVGASEFTEEDEWLSQAHAAQAGRIYENRNLYAQLERRASDLAAEIHTRQAAERQLHRVLRARQVMAECSRTLVRATDETSLLADACRFLVEIGGYGAAWVGLVRRHGEHTVDTVASAGDGTGIAGIMKLSGDNVPGGGPAGAAMRSGEPQIVPGTPSQLPRGVRAAALLPLVFEAHTFGVLGIVALETPAFDAEELELLVELAGDVAFGIDTQRARVVQQQLAATLELRNRAIEESMDAVVISAADRRADNPVIYVNRAFTQMTGYDPAEAIGRNVRFLLGTDWEQPDIERLREAVRLGRDVRVTLRNYRKDGSLLWNEVSLASMRGPRGEVSHFIAIFSDVTDRMRYEEELEQRATHDALTGLANRTLLNDRMQRAIIRARRDGAAVAVMLIDIDRFKLINDSLGHATGDGLLQEAARRLTASVRRGDTVARLGGDEFMIVMSDMSTEDDAATLAAKALDALAAPMTLNGREIIVTASIGISLHPRDGDVAATLLKHADVAMYRAKELGRNRFQFYAPEMNARILERLELETSLRRALEKGELELHYQPKVELAGGRVVGAEALVRWRHPRLGMVPPGDFIPLAEESGLIVPIGEWVIDDACRQMRAWRDDGLGDISVAVNVSARQFQHEQLAEVLARSLERHGVSAGRLHLELTESAVMSNPDKALVTLRALKAIGVRISLDDFGTGYSSLNYLKRFPIDSIKIDRSFVTDLATSAEDAAIAMMVISLGHSLEQTVIAEGVEDRVQLDFLRRHRCDEMQGYLFSPPLTATAFASLLRTGERLDGPVAGSPRNDAPPA